MDHMTQVRVASFPGQTGCGWERRLSMGPTNFSVNPYHPNFILVPRPYEGGCLGMRLKLGWYGFTLKWVGPILNRLSHPQPAMLSYIASDWLDIPSTLSVISPTSTNMQYTFPVFHHVPQRNRCIHVCTSSKQVASFRWQYPPIRT